MKKLVLLFAVLGSVFFAGCAKQDSTETKVEQKSEGPAGEEVTTEMSTETTTETAQ